VRKKPKGKKVRNYQHIVQVHILFTLLKRPTGKRWIAQSFAAAVSVLAWTLTVTTPILLPHSVPALLISTSRPLPGTYQGTPTSRFMRRRRRSRCKMHASHQTSICLTRTTKTRDREQILVHPQPREIVPHLMKNVMKIL